MKKIGIMIAAAMSVISAYCSPVREALAARSAMTIDSEEGMVVVEYLESTGAQYINTEVYPEVGDVIDSTFMLGNITVYGALFGCSQTSDGVLPAVWIKSTYRIHSLFCGGSFASSRNTYSSGDILNVVVNLRPTDMHTYINGVLLQKPRGAAALPSIPYHVFCTTYASGAAPYYAVGSGTRCYGFSIVKGDTLVCDYQPVRFTNEQGRTEGAMYDFVSGELFRNQGTGDFIIGPDKE